MLKNSKMLTITVPRKTYYTIRQEAKKRDETISGLLRHAFEYLTQEKFEVYSDKELATLLKKDRLSSTMRSDLDRLLAIKSN